jgi:transposase
LPQHVSKENLDFKKHNPKLSRKENLEIKKYNLELIKKYKSKLSSEETLELKQYNLKVKKVLNKISRNYDERSKNKIAKKLFNDQNVSIEDILNYQDSKLVKMLKLSKGPKKHHFGRSKS